MRWEAGDAPRGKGIELQCRMMKREKEMGREKEKKRKERKGVRRKKVKHRRKSFSRNSGACLEFIDFKELC